MACLALSRERSTTVDMAICGAAHRLQCVAVLLPPGCQCAAAAAIAEGSGGYDFIQVGAILPCFGMQLGNNGFCLSLLVKWKKVMLKGTV